MFVRKMLPGLVLALLVASPAVAQHGPATQDVSGTWTLTFDSPMGPLEWTVDLEQDGHRLVGSIRASMGEMKIDGGTIEDGRVFFSVMAGDEDHSVWLEFTGRMHGEEMRGTVTGMHDEVPEWRAVRKRG